MKNNKKLTLLLVLSKRSTFTNIILRREDIDILLLEIEAGKDSYLKKETRGRESFTYRITDTSDIENEALKFKSWIKKNGYNYPTFFCNPNEAAQHTAQDFAKKLSLPHLSPFQVEVVRNKIVMKQFFNQIGIPCAKFKKIESKEEIIDFAKARGYPVILKPTDSDSCIDTYKLMGDDDIPALNTNKRWMVEEYISGEEYQICALVSKGKVLDAYIAKNPSPIIEVFDGGMNANVTLSKSEKKPINPTKIMQKITSELVIDRGYLHGEFFVKPSGEFYMGEVAARLSGCEAPLNHSLSYGFDFLNAIIDTYIEKTPDILYTKDKSVGDLLLPVKKGKITKLSSSSELLDLPGVISCNMNYKIGDTIKIKRSSGFCSGYVQVEGKNSEEVISKMANILKNFIIEVR